MVLRMRMSRWILHRIASLVSDLHVYAVHNCQLLSPIDRKCRQYQLGVLASTRLSSLLPTTLERDVVTSAVWTIYVHASASSPSTSSCQTLPVAVDAAAPLVVTKALRDDCSQRYRNSLCSLHSASCCCSHCCCMFVQTTAGASRPVSGMPSSADFHHKTLHPSRTHRFPGRT
uniref:Putative secreted protein n=1 Tax=Anopheles marajoara TaxID=58244 RepID=A0A2M4C679_9DIPT